MPSLARRLVAIRLSYGESAGEPEISRNRFAELLGVKGPTYGRYERAEMEPGLAVLAAIHRLTGASLDYLILGIGPAGTNQAAAAPQISVGMRVAWVRELFEPDINEAASVMGVPVKQWVRWEQSLEDIPYGKLREFAHRFNVSVEYLLLGDARRLPRIVFRLLARRHPEFSPRHSNGTATDCDSTILVAGPDHSEDERVRQNGS